MWVCAVNAMGCSGNLHLLVIGGAGGGHVVCIEGESNAIYDHEESTNRNVDLVKAAK